MIVDLVDGPLPKLTMYGYPIAAPERSTNYPHVTPIIIQFLKNMGKYPYDTSDGENPIRDMYFEAGFIWEELLSYAFGERLVGTRPPEIVMDGIAMSPDGVTCWMDQENFDSWGETQVTAEDFQLMATNPDGSGVSRLHEYKFTKKSIPLPKGEDAVLEKFTSNEYWMMQAMAYCRAVGTTLCRHHVLHVNGDYAWKDATQIVYQIYETQFDEEEIETNWELILREGKEMGIL